MQYAHDPRSFVFSHYVYRGLRSATGVVGATLIAMQFTDLPTAMVVSMGALCTSLMDLPSPLNHKFNEMLASVLLCTAVTLMVALVTPFPRVLPVVLVMVTFLAGMMTVYGNKALPLQFCALFVMTLTINEDFLLRKAFTHTLLFALGAAAYMGYSMLVSWLGERRTRQQILAESLYELGAYLEVKATFYDAGNDFDAGFNDLVRQQIVVAERQQAARDLLLRHNRTPHDGLLVQVHLRMLELYEYVLSTNTDYPLLRTTFGGTPVLDRLRDIVMLMCRDVESMAFDITRGRPSYSEVDYRDAVHAVEHEIAQLRHHHISRVAMTALEETLEMLRGAIALLAQLHVASRTPVEPAQLLPGQDMAPFLTRQKYELSMLRDNLRWRSPAFRFALRITMAVTVGLVLAEHLPYASHSYWILLTIIVILKPNFSLTKQRYNDRVIGTLIGCVISVGILRVVHQPLALLAILFLALVASTAFSTIKYRYTAIAACIQVLIQINLLVPGSNAVAGERLIDTVIGGIIASAFSFVLPSWEYRAIPQLVEGVLQANRRYIAATRDLLLRKTADDFAYRVERRQFMNSLTALVSSFQRMLDEPRNQRRGVDNLNRFIVQNYLVAAHVAAARIQVRQHYQELDLPAAQAAIVEATDAATRSLLQASEALVDDGRQGGRGAGFIRPGKPQPAAAGAMDGAVGATASAAAVAAASTEAVKDSAKDAATDAATDATAVEILAAASAGDGESARPTSALAEPDAGERTVHGAAARQARDAALDRIRDRTEGSADADDLATVAAMYPTSGAAIQPPAPSRLLPPAGVEIEGPQPEAAADRRVRLADSADRRQAKALAQAAGNPDAVAAPESAASSSTGRVANALLERRLRELRADAARIALRTGAIGRAVRERD